MDRLDAVLKTSSGEQETSIKTKEIDQLYEAVLASAMNEDLEQLEKDQIQLVLHTVICAQEPLTVVALAGLLGLTSGRVEAALKPLWSVVRVSESSPEDRVSTMHASFPDYMLNPSRSGRFTCNVKAHNARLVEFCFSRIRKNTDQFNICNLSSSHVFDKDVPDIEERVKQKIPLDLLYACEYWAVHLCLSGSLSEGLHQLRDFLSKRLLLWIEVLNLKNRIHKAAVLIDGTLSWLQAIPDSEGTTRLARDARRFVTLFATSPVSASTPHIYVSMLTSWPSRQSVSEHYAHRVERPISITGLQAADRQQSLLSLIPARSQIYCVAYSSNGAFFAAGTFDGRVLVWDAMTLQLTIDPVCAHNQTVNGIAISPDDTQVCSCSADMTICIWDIHTGAQIAGPLTGHTHQVWSVDYSRDGKWLASGSLDGTVRIWSTDTWLMQSGPLGNENKRVVSVVFSPDSTVLAAGSESQICLWDPLSGQKIREPLSHHTGLVTTLTFLHDGAYLVSGSYDHTICVWDVSTGQLAHGPFREHSSSVTAVIASPTGHLLVSASMGSTMRIWDTATWHTYALFRSTGLVRSVKFSPDGQRLLSGSADANIRIWEVPQAPADSTTCKQSEAHDDWVRSVAFSPCGTFIVSGSSDMTVRMWDTQKQPPTCTTLTAHRDRVLAVGISADSSHIFSLSQDRIVCVWERQTGQLEYTAGPIETDGDYDPMYQDFWPAVFVFDDRRVVCGSRSGRIYMWQDGNQTHELTGHTAPVYSIALSADSQRFVSGDGIGDLIVWDARTGQQLHGPFSTHSRDVNDVAFSPDGSHIASASGDTTVHLWKPDNATQSSTSLRGHSDIVLCVAYSHRGDRVISGSSDRTIRMWDVASGTSIAVLTGHIGDVLSVAFSGDGRQFASGSADGTIRVWNAPACEGDSQSKPNDSMARQPRVTGDHGGCDWTIDSDGWVHDQDSRLVLWVPPDLRSGLVMPQNTMVMSSQGSIELDFMDARIGDMWQSCYRPL
ncbi:putative WD repeat-containing protein alr3466 OS=Nostoc sp, (strain PCC 7120 / UTEX 2576) GN=alr3466 PE=4 SV=1 [Rhizoctonia solani AG-1 IB]|uniref:Putative WD repeat-containing protein alr3466 n=1 Tax=Thanatephorus cucumeris (strain AG1-IB / isolate 7/3/14) TaxID=1108050 RepID=A0A0B7FD60_THACB|nr:putative WD repeat-containing protein alr3466 OS=Nostoc sp, (strain PCC 7120 / UTEX 2576) GN=alr3466 PE=4 SV=1 [Rhizoctonia solani AG-1 IB]